MTRIRIKRVYEPAAPDDGISDEEELLHREVIQGDADLYYLHHYLSEVFRNGDNF